MRRRAAKVPRRAKRPGARLAIVWSFDFPGAWKEEDLVFEEKKDNSRTPQFGCCFVGCSKKPFGWCLFCWEKWRVWGLHQRSEVRAHFRVIVFRGQWERSQKPPESWSLLLRVLFRSSFVLFKQNCFENSLEPARLLNQTTNQPPGSHPRRGLSNLVAGRGAAQKAGPFQKSCNFSWGKSAYWSGWCLREILLRRGDIFFGYFPTFFCVFVRVKFLSQARFLWVFQKGKCKRVGLSFYNGFQ